MHQSSPPDNSKKPPLSCAECRRLKLKCNRVWPCSSCEKRGLAELCPEGSLATRPRTRPPPPTPQHVLQRIYELQSRINELEVALGTLQATVSTEPHPMLQGNSLPYLQQKLMRKAALAKALKQGYDAFLEADDTSQSPQAENDDPEEIADALGTLSIAPDGKSRFFGPTAVSEGLSTGQDTEPPVNMTTLPVDIAAMAQSFPFNTTTEVLNNMYQRIRSYLPPLERAEVLCNSYFSYASFVSDIVLQDEVFEDLFYRLYGTRRSCRRLSAPPPQTDAYQWHHVPSDELSLFFSVMAMGALTDLTSKPFSAEAEMYYQLSRALLTRQNVLTEPTLPSVQALFLGSYYEGMQSQGNSSRDCWIMMALACKTAQIIGLHRDHGMFGLDDRDVQRRRLIFWEIHSLDVIESLAFGRPICFTFAHTDTKMPVDTHATTNSAGEVEESFNSWKYRFCAEVLSVVGDHVLRVKTPSYASALEADRKLREFTNTFGRGVRHAEVTDPHMAAQRQMMLGTRETSMLYIHRVFFAHAVSTEPATPERSKYGRSVVTAFESARLIVQGMQYFVRNHAEFAARLWFLWNHLLSASFVLGSIVARAPGSSLAPPALTLLATACDILARAAVYGGRAEFMLPIVAKLRAKGHTAPAGAPADGGGDNDDELAVIGGRTRVVLASRPASRSPPGAYAPPPFLLFARARAPVPAADDWQQGEYLHGLDAADAGAVFLAAGGNGGYAPQYAHGDDALAPAADIGSRGWQSLVQDLGV